MHSSGPTTRDPPVLTPTSTLKDFVTIGYLPDKSVMHYHVPDLGEEKPQSKDNEVIVFTDHMNWCFSPPGSKFFRDILHFFKLHPQDIGPNSISNVCNFQVFCEVYLQEEPSVELFREYFYLNRQNEFTNGPNLELGGISIQRRRDAISLKQLCWVTQGLEPNMVLLQRYLTVWWKSIVGLSA